MLELYDPRRAATSINDRDAQILDFLWQFSVALMGGVVSMGTGCRGQDARMPRNDTSNLVCG